MRYVEVDGKRYVVHRYTVIRSADSITQIGIIRPGWHSGAWEWEGDDPPGKRVGGVAGEYKSFKAAVIGLCEWWESEGRSINERDSERRRKAFDKRWE